jgi:hypothetical protein
MPRVEAYGGDQVRTAPLPRMRRTATPPVPTADVFGGQVGQTLTQAGTVLGQIAEEQQKRANEHFATTVDTQLNQLYQVQGLGTDRGPSGTRGLLTMTGMEPQEKFEDNLKDYDAQTAEILKQAKNPEQRLIGERMVNQARARYVDSAMRHASAEYAQAETGQKQAQLKSTINLAGAAAGTPGGQEVIDEKLLRIEEIIWYSGDKLGLHTDDEKRVAMAEAQSAVHVLAVEKLLSSDKVPQAQAYFDRVMAPSPGYPQGEILENQAKDLRTKLDVNTTDAWGLMSAQEAWKEFKGPKPGDPNAPVRIAEMIDYVTTKAGTDTKKRNAAVAYLRDMESAVEGQRANQEEANKGTLYNMFQQKIPLVTLRETPAWKNASEGLQGEIRNLYDQRARQELADQRAAESAAREREGDDVRAYRLDQDRRAIRGNATYERLSTDPAMLANMSPSALQAELAANPVSDAQRQRLLELQQSIQASVENLTAANTDNDMFKQEAYRAGENYVYNTNPNETQRARLGNLRSRVDAAIAQEEVAVSRGKGHKVRLSVEAQRQVMRRVLAETVMVDRGYWYGGTVEMARALVVNAEDRANVRMPLAKIPPDEVTKAVNIIRSNRPSLQRKDDAAIIREYQRIIERAYGAYITDQGDEEVMKRLQENP